MIIIYFKEQTEGCFHSALNNIALKKSTETNKEKWKRRNDPALASGWLRLRSYIKNAMIIGESPRWQALQRKHSRCYPSPHPVVIVFQTLARTTHISHRGAGSSRGEETWTRTAELEEPFETQCCFFFFFFFLMKLLSLGAFYSFVCKSFFVFFFKIK